MLMYQILASNNISILLNVHGFNDRIVQWTRKIFTKTQYILYFDPTYYSNISPTNRGFFKLKTQSRIFSMDISNIFVSLFVFVFY